MHDPTIPRNLADTLRDITRRLSALERSPQLPNSSMRGGSTRLLDNDGNVLWAAGNVNFVGAVGGDAYGAFTFDTAGAMVDGAATGFRGRIYPSTPISLHSSAAVTITSSSFVSVFEGGVQNPDGDVYQIIGAVETSSGTTGEVRLTMGSTHSAVLSVPASTNKFYEFDWEHPSTSGINDPRAGREQAGIVIVEARRVSGTGSVFLLPPQTSEITSSFIVTGAATDGNPRFLT